MNMRKDRVSVATQTRRRRMLVLALIVTVTFSLGSVVMAQTSKSTAVKNIVVVHGAFADGSGWEGVHAILTKDGYTVTIVQNPLISLEGDVAATKRAIANLSGPVMLVGHSYGGALITETGRDCKIFGLVYMAAFPPHQGGPL